MRASALLAASHSRLAAISGGSKRRLALRAWLAVLSSRCGPVSPAASAAPDVPEWHLPTVAALWAAPLRRWQGAHGKAGARGAAEAVAHGGVVGVLIYTGYGRVWPERKMVFAPAQDPPRRFLPRRGDMDGRGARPRAESAESAEAFSAVRRRSGSKISGLAPAY